MKLQDRVAIVTGAASGIGRAIALRLAKEGADVVIADIDLEHANEVCSEIRALGRKALALKVDVTKTEDTNRMAKATLDEFGSIDILVNNVGGAVRKSKDRNIDFHVLPKELCDATIDLNVGGTLNCCRSVVGQMIQKKGGKIVNIASTAGVMGTTGMADYSLAKGAVIAFTKALGKELAFYGINVNCVSPAAIAHLMADGRDPTAGESWQREKQTLFIRRFGRPEDVANMVAFLASDEASYVVGQNIPTCGGRSLGGIVDKEW